MALTAKQELFVREYLVCGDPATAYRKAGYKPKTNESAVSAASRLLMNVEVCSAIAAGQKKTAERNDLTVDWIVQELRDNARLAKGCEQFGASTKALELLGKHIGMWQPAPLSKDDEDNAEDLTPEECAEEARQMAQDYGIPTSEDLAPVPGGPSPHTNGHAKANGSLLA